MVRRVNRVEDGVNTGDYWLDSDGDLHVYDADEDNYEKWINPAKGTCIIAALQDYLGANEKLPEEIYDATKGTVTVEQYNQLRDITHRLIDALAQK